MFDIRKPTKEDYKKFAPALRFARQNDNADNGYYMIVENGQRRHPGQHGLHEAFLPRWKLSSLPDGRHLEGSRHRPRRGQQQSPFPPSCHQHDQQ